MNIEQSLSTKKDVKNFFDHVIKVEKCNFHPDDNFEDMIDLSTKKPSFDSTKAAVLNARMKEAFAIAGDEIYDLAVDAFLQNQELLKKEANGGSLNGLPPLQFEKGGQPQDKIELFYVMDEAGSVKNISTSYPAANTFLEKSLKFQGKIGHALVSKQDYLNEKITVANIKDYKGADNHFLIEQLAKGGDIKRKSIKPEDIKVGDTFALITGEQVKIKKLFIENGNENWVGYERNGKYEENSLQTLKIFLNNLKAVKSAPTVITSIFDNGVKDAYTALATKYFSQSPDLQVVEKNDKAIGRYKEVTGIHNGTTLTFYVAQSPEKLSDNVLNIKTIISTSLERIKNYMADRRAIEKVYSEVGVYSFNGYTVRAANADQAYAKIKGKALKKYGGNTQPLTVQSVLFSKKSNQKSDARKWLRDHGFESLNLEETENFYRSRQKNPNKFDPDSFVTKEIKPGVKYIFALEK